MTKKLERKYLGILVLLIAANGGSIALAEESTCVRPAGHLSSVCGTVTIKNGEAKINNLHYPEGSLANDLFLFVKPHHFSAKSLCREFLSETGYTFETASKSSGIVNEMFQRRNGSTDCRGHRALFSVTCGNLSEI